LSQKLNLIYRASRDGFEASQFHAKCDNKPNTLIIIKSTNRAILSNKIYSPFFGAGDLVISNESNTKTTSSSNLYHYYTHPDNDMR
jgi:hypothetical protein